MGSDRNRPSFFNEGFWWKKSYLCRDKYVRLFQKTSESFSENMYMFFPVSPDPDKRLRI